MQFCSAQVGQHIYMKMSKWVYAFNKTEGEPERERGKSAHIWSIEINSKVCAENPQSPSLWPENMWYLQAK